VGSVPAQPQSWRTAPCRLSVTTYSVYSQTLSCFIHPPCRVDKGSTKHSSTFSVIIIVKLWFASVQCNFTWSRNQTSPIFSKTVHRTRTLKKMAVFWDVAPCSLIEIDRRFRDAYYLHHQLISLTFNQCGSVDPSKASRHYTKAYHFICFVTFSVAYWIPLWVSVWLLVMNTWCWTVFSREPLLDPFWEHGQVFKIWSMLMEQYKDFYWNRDTQGWTNVNNSHACHYNMRHIAHPGEKWHNSIFMGYYWPYIQTNYW
jgi:hypothetical protein